MSEPVLYEVKQQVAWITLNRPETRNALSVELTRAFDAAVRQALADPQVRVLGITHIGPIYCAGVDLKVSEGSPEAGATERLPTTFHLHYESLFKQLWNSPKPTVARLLGGAFGAGVGMVAVCDIVVAADTAQFAISELRFGRIPSRVPVLMMHKGMFGLARSYMLTGERFDAETALAMHLVQHVVPAPEIDHAVQRQIASLLQCAPEATAELKRGLLTIPDLTLAEAMERGSEIIARMFLSPSDEMKEGKAAFRAKRKPRWAIG
ncbi:MAG: enoyl-CoA hydratase/isomerase family protein [Candidatus Lambdaproteobacteria bacterium]|nr:enoyl-CoA hydratase/isomerase family protein [Candidatus Lambdaproteobacteria bacterium]